MGRIIVKLAEDAYVEWSSVVDAPVTNVMTRDDLDWYIKEEYGKEGLRELPRRMERVEKNGTSSHDGTTIASLLAYNRAGHGERHVKTVRGLLRLYKKKEAGARRRA